MVTAQEVAESSHRTGGRAEMGNGRTRIMGWVKQSLRFWLSPKGPVLREKRV